MNQKTIRINGERIEELSLRSGTIEREIEEITKRISSLREQVAGVESEFNLVNDEKDSKHQLLTENEASFNTIVNLIGESQKGISDNKTQILDNASNQSRIKNELQKVMAMLNTASSRHRRLNIESDNSATEMTQIDQRHNDAQILYQQQGVALDGAQEKLDVANRESEELDRQARDKTLLIDELKQNLASSGSKLDLLKDMKTKREGFSDGVKAYMEFIEDSYQAKESFIGIVADMLTPKEGFFLPLECALSGKSQLIVVRTAEAIREAVDYLKKNQKGRAQFLALDEISDAHADSVELSSPTIINKLSDCVEVKYEHDKLFL